MLIIDLIEKLQALYNTYDDEYKSIAGEPEIMIDVFQRAPGKSECRFYAGFSGTIVIDKSSDGVYDILSTFYEDHYQNPQAAQLPSDSLPQP